MKQIFLVRHAKSSWKDTSLADFDRPLNKRGKKDVIFMGKLLKDLGVKPDLILSSPAKRTKRTAISIAEEIRFPKNQIVLNNEIFEASDRVLLNVLKRIDEKFSSVMLIAHNPGLTYLNNFISNKYIDNIPTCGVVSLKTKKEWIKAGENSFEFLFFEYPKKYQ